MGDTQANQRKKTRGEDYIAQGSILAVAVVITKIIGVVYRIPLTNILGDEGNGFYGYAYQVYAIALMLSSLSLPTAVSKLVSVRMAVGQRRNAFRVFFMFPYICCFGRNYYISCDLSRSRSDFGTYDESAFQCLRT